VHIDHPRTTLTASTPLNVPAELLDSIARHQTHLAALVASLRAAGLQEDMIEISVRTLTDSYADELTTVIRKLMREERRG
jgi:tRNA A37 threonylcarbamoyladenosine dehydratase